MKNYMLAKRFLNSVFVMFLLCSEVVFGQDTASIDSTEAGRKDLFEVQKRIQKLEREIRNTTVGGLANEIRNTPKKTKYTEEERRRIVAVQKLFSTTSKANITRDGWVQVPYGETPVINCTLKGFCTIALEPGERSVSVNVTDTIAWSANKRYFGPNGVIEVIVVNPRFSDAYAQMDIMTDKGRFYTVFLDSNHLVEMQDGSIPIHSMKLRFNYPSDSDSLTNAFGNYQSNSDALAEKIVSMIGNKRMAESERESSEGSYRNNATKTRKSYDTETNFSVNFVGGRRGNKKPSWKPIRAYSDNIGNVTYIELPRSYKEIPSIFVVGRDNKNSQVTARLKGEHENIIEIDGVHDRIVLRTLDSGIKKAYETAFEVVRVL